MATLSCPKKTQAIYRPRRPEKTVLFEVVKKHYKTWHRNAENSVPHYVDKEFTNYLSCGILAKGFACARCEDCRQEFLLAFSCKGRGICPSCNARAMCATAAHLVENIIPHVPVRQFVMSFPMRIRHYLQTQEILQTILKIVVDEIRKRFIACGPKIANAQIGAVSFIQHFGNTLNVHPHFHILVADGIFNTEDEDLFFHETMLTLDDIADTQDAIQRRVLRFFCRRGWFDQESVKKMLSYENSGFSLDATVRTEAFDRAGLERLIRYCARPPFASENLRWNGPWLVYRFPKPARDGRTFIQLEPLDFIERIAAFIPYPRRHRRHYHGVFAPSSPLRKRVAVSAQKARVQELQMVQETVEKVEKVSFNWSKLIARIYEVNPLVCSACGKEIKIIAFVTHSSQIWRILKGVGWSTDVPEFDHEYEVITWNICQLVGGGDGFPDMESQAHPETVPDPPWQYFVEPDPPHWNQPCDPPFWED
jgi:putative transposase/transposase-like zinc-binding protein